jgi:hypothetical protein
MFSLLGFMEQNCSLSRVSMGGKGDYTLLDSGSTCIHK